MGKVYFVGAGPNDSSLLTRGGYEILQQADCVLYDHLLDKELLSITKGDCIYVGKQAGRHSMPQEEINELLVKCAKKYDCVVRLKGGDSFVFGRGGEEGMILHEHGIPFSFHPGVSSAIAALEMAGIPITHRGMASGFQVLSAHLQDHTLNIQPEQVKNPDITTVFLMGLSRLKELCALLRQAKRAESTPMAVIMQGCSPSQRVICATLKTIEARMKQEVLHFPGIVVAGNVIRLREQLVFYEKKPLFGKTILVTKVQKEPSPLTTLLKEEGAIVEELQTGEIYYRNVDGIEDALCQSERIVFTSRHGVHGFFQNLERRNKDARSLASHTIYAIGNKTAQALHHYGILADHIAQGDPATLYELLKMDEKHRPLLYVKGEQARAITQAECNAVIHECIVYEQRAIAHKEFAIKPYDAICFSCASSVERISASLQNSVCVSIGKTTSDALRKRQAKQILEAENTSYEAMCKRLCKEVMGCIEEED